ncbi:transposase [Gelidibacter gilvus]|uniref:Transposase n=1 Tax=Gelidibacter gilvus TaxID=59602 RepID=A0A4Q0XL18_9FLAO|nr:transposase [Gelidibacter gilvus]RXJ51407.1 transposase [Gelidibacter gilvus]
MADKFQNKYRITSARLQTWDYRWQGAYFITICMKNKSHYFGKVINNKMELTNVGVLADVFWHEIKNHSKNITLGEFIVMPKHIHGILIINADPDDIPNSPDLNEIMDEFMDDSNSDYDANAIHNPIAETRHALSLADAHENSDANENSDMHENTNANQNTIPPTSIGQNRLRNPGKNSISSIIGGYKSAVTKHANRLKLDFGWQTRFYDHVIRDENAFNTISNYIKNNPKKWGEDKFRS